MALYMKRQSQQGNKVFASSSKQSTQPNVSKMFKVCPNSGPSEVVLNDPNEKKKKKKTRALPASWNRSAQPNISKKLKSPANYIPPEEDILNEFEVEEDRMFSSSENENPNHQKKNNTRGPTRGLDTVKLAAAMGKEKLPIKIDVMQGRPTNGVQSAKLSSELGLISREYLDEMPIRWTREFKKNHLTSAYDRLGMQLEVEDIEEEPVQESINELLQRQCKQQRHRLKQIFLKCRDAEEARAKKPSGVSQQNWDVLVDYWSDDKTVHIAEMNTMNRQKIKAMHRQGRKAFVVLREEVKKTELNGEECDRITLYKRAYHSEAKGWQSEHAEANYNKMQELQAEGKMTVDEICNTVLGEKPGYISGLGHGPKPIASSNSTNKRLEAALKQVETEKNGWKSECVSLRTEVGLLREEVSGMGILKAELADVKELLGVILRGQKV